MNFGRIVDRVQLTLGAEDALINDETVLIKEYVNEGVIDILIRTRPHTRCLDLTLTPDVGRYDLSSSILSLKDVESGGAFLEAYSREDIVARQAIGAPGYAYEEPMLWISPIPSEANTIGAYGVLRPNPMVVDSDDPSNPGLGGLAPEFHPAIVNYACWKTGEYVQHEQSQGGERWRVLYEG